MAALFEFFDPHIAKPNLRAFRPGAGAAVDLKGEVPFVLENVFEFLITLILSDFRAIDPGRNHRRVADHFAANRVPVAVLPDLRPVGKVDLRLADFFVIRLGHELRGLDVFEHLFAVIGKYAIDGECAVSLPVETFAVDLTDIAGVVVVDHHLVAASLFGAAHKEPGTRAPVGIGLEDHVEVAEFLVGEQNSPIAAAGRVLLAGDGAVFDLPHAAVAMTDFFRILVPALEVFAVE